MWADADRVHALVARCLTDSAYLGNPEASATLGRELDRVALFQGFITKVKHNRLRGALPFTLQLLASLGEDLAFFADYSPAYAALRSAGPVSLDAHCEHLSRHLQAYVAILSPGRGALASAVNAHENLLRRLAGPDAGPAPAAPAQAEADRDPDAVRWDGRLILARYGVDVLAACAALRARTAGIGTEPFQRGITVACWRGEGEDIVRAFEVDAATGLMLSLVDGRRSRRGIAAAFEAAVGRETDPEEVGLFLREVEAHGIRARASVPA